VLQQVCNGLQTQVPAEGLGRAVTQNPVKRSERQQHGSILPYPDGVTRIIGGLAGSIHLASPAKSTRPTADRIRESIFNRLENWEALEGARVLDLYAGTGALGLEALSRGASSVILVDSNKQAAAVCRTNLELVGKSLLKQGAQFDGNVVAQDAKAFAHHQSERSAGFEDSEFDLVFIDPPYDVTNHEIEAILTYLKSALHEEFTVLVERSSRTEEPAWPAGYQLEARKDYGDTSVFWLVESD
jgi:16S rRNA (guanine966-N2)-methyltransferase